MTGSLKTVNEATVGRDGTEGEWGIEWVSPVDGIKLDMWVLPAAGFHLRYVKEKCGGS